MNVIMHSASDHQIVTYSNPIYKSKCSGSNMGGSRTRPQNRRLRILGNGIPICIPTSKDGKLAGSGQKVVFKLNSWLREPQHKLGSFHIKQTNHMQY